MLFKLMILFLLAMVAVAMIGSWLFPGALGRQIRRRLTQRKPAACTRCGRPMIGRTCACGGKG
jgi:hypothetical protein